MTLEQAFQVIAATQAALVQAGYNLGNWGPCADGIDGRWGPDSRAAWGQFLKDQGLGASQGSEALARLGLGIDQNALQTAINEWNKYRKSLISAGMASGSVAYETRVVDAFGRATGITSSTCATAPTPQGVQEPVTDLYYQPPEKEGIPIWLWILLGLVFAGVIGGGIWYGYKYKKSKRRKSRSSGMNGYGKKAGTEVTDIEFGGSGGEDEEDEYT